jgi:hypothetical protein
MWIRRSHALAPLSAMCSVNVKFKWEEEHQKAFDLVKRIVAREVLLSHPDCSIFLFIFIQMQANYNWEL